MEPRQPCSGGEEGADPGLRNPARAGQAPLHTPASATVALSQEAVCCDQRQNPPSVNRALRRQIPVTRGRRLNGTRAPRRMDQCRRHPPT